MPQDWPLKFGAFFAPFHPVGQSPTLAYEYDLDRAEWLDKFGYDEVWFGEHHSGGYELIGSPEIFIAAAAQRTKHIKLGTGVTSLPYHHPWLVADRWVQLDHMTRGRCIFGTGPGALPTDAYMMGIDPVNQRRMMEESLEAIYALFASKSPSRARPTGSSMNDGRLQVRPYTYPHPEIAVAAMVTPSGPRLAGQHGVVVAVAVDADGRRVRRHRQGVGRRERAGGEGRRPDARPPELAHPRHDAHRRDAVTRRSTTACTASRSSPTTSAAAPASCRWPRRSTGPAPTRDVRRGVRRVAVVGDRHARRRHRIHRRPHRAVGRLRHVPACSATTGRRPSARMNCYRLFAEKVMPHFQGQLNAPRDVARLGHGQARRAVRSRRAGDDERDPVPRARRKKTDEEG